MRILRSLPLALLLAFLLLSNSWSAQTGEESMLEQSRRHFQSGKYSFAATWLGRILRDYPSTSHRQEVLLLISKAYALSGRDDKAAPYLRSLLKEFPETAATLPPELLQLAKSTAPSPPDQVAKPPAPSGEKPLIPSSAGPSALLPIPAPRLPERLPPPAKPAPPAAVAAPPAPAAAEHKTPGEPFAAKQATAPETPVPSRQAAEQAPAPAKPPPSGEPPVSRADGNDTMFYTLATGETVNRGKFESLQKKLEALGFLPVVQVETKQGEVYRLVAGCYGDRKSAEKRQAEISRRGGKAFVSRSDDSFCVVAGSLMSEAAAQQEKNRLAGKGVQVKIFKAQVPLTFWRISVGQYADARQAAEAAKTLAARGIAATVVKAVD